MLLSIIIQNLLLEARSKSLQMICHLESINSLTSFCSRSEKILRNLSLLIGKENPEINSYILPKFNPIKNNPSLEQVRENIIVPLEECLSLIDQKQYPDLYKKILALRKSKFLI